jgi:hypothetical protein
VSRSSAWCSYYPKLTQNLRASRNQLNFFTNSRVNPGDQIFVFFSEEKSVGVKTMRKLVVMQTLISIMY